MSPSYPAPPSSVLAAISVAEDKHRIRRMIAQATLFVFMGSFAVGSFVVVLLQPETPLSRVWFWVFGFGALLSLFSYGLLQIVSLRWPARFLHQAYLGFLGALRARGHRALAVSSENLVHLFSKCTPEDSRHGFQPYAEAFDSLIVLMGQVLHVEARLKALPTTDLQSCLEELERLRNHIAEDLWTETAPQKPELQGEPLELAQQELSLRLEHAEWHASLMEAVLVLESSLVKALDGVAAALRMVVGQRAAVVVVRRREFEDWWLANKVLIARDLQDLISKVPRS